jgi:hypothetical protein
MECGDTSPLFGVRWHDIAFPDAIPHCGTSNQLVSPESDEGGSADMSAHSKSAFRMPPGQRVAPARRTKLGDDGNQTCRAISQRRRTGTLFLNSFWDGRWGQLAFEFRLLESETMKIKTIISLAAIIGMLGVTGCKPKTTTQMPHQTNQTTVELAQSSAEQTGAFLNQ